jgi:hypothetical protein
LVPLQFELDVHWTQLPLLQIGVDPPQLALDRQPTQTLEPLQYGVAPEQPVAQ